MYETMERNLNLYETSISQYFVYVSNHNLDTLVGFEKNFWDEFQGSISITYKFQKWPCLIGEGLD